MADTVASHEAAQYAKYDDRQFESEDQAVLFRALRDFDADTQADQTNREEMVNDLWFQAGEQWDELARLRRELAGRPTFSVDMIAPFIRQVDGELRKNPPALAVHPVENDDFDLANVMAGMVRGIEQLSGGGRVYATAGGQSAACGMGSWRISHEYETQGSNLTCLRLRSIPNPLAVVWDCGAVLPDRSDANHVFVYEDMPRQKFKDRYKDAFNQAGWPEAVGNALATRWGWITADTVRVAEYWVKEPVKSALVQMSNGDYVRVTTPEDQQQVIAYAERGIMPAQNADGTPMIRPDPIMKICMYLLTASMVLAKYEWKGSILPIFTTFGEEIHVEKTTVRRGIVRTLRDPQRIRNWGFSAAVETTALGTNARWLATAKHVAGREEEWRQANNIPTSTLIYNYDKDAPNTKPERIDPPDENLAALKLMEVSKGAMRDAAGMYGDSVGEKDVGQSGVAIENLQRAADTGTFLYVDNLLPPMQSCGRALCEMIPQIYDTPRMVRILGNDMAASIVRINDGRYNLADAGKFDLIYTMGPSFESQRAETRASMEKFAAKLPPQAQIPIILRIADLQDWPGKDTLKDDLAQAMGLAAAPGGAAAPEAVPGSVSAQAPPEGAPPAPQPVSGMPDGGPTASDVYRSVYQEKMAQLAPGPREMADA